MSRHPRLRSTPRKGLVGRAFTLVEILIVVVILGILAAIVIPQFTTAAESSKESALKQDVFRFREQIEALKMLLITAGPTAEQQKDIDSILALGELFALVVYGQLILEAAPIHGIDNDLIDQIFDFMVRDFSAHALDLAHKSSTTEMQSGLCLQMIRRPAIDPERFGRVWQHVRDLDGQYEMNP